MIKLINIKIFKSALNNKDDKNLDEIINLLKLSYKILNLKPR